MVPSRRLEKRAVGGQGERQARAGGRGSQEGGPKGPRRWLPEGTAGGRSAPGQDPVPDPGQVLVQIQVPVPDTGQVPVPGQGPVSFKAL